MPWHVAVWIGRRRAWAETTRWFTMRNVDLLVEDPALPGELLGEQLSPRDWLLNGLSHKVAANLARDL